MHQSQSTSLNERSPPRAEQSLFAELGAFDDVGSDRFGTPGRSSVASIGSSPTAQMSPNSRRTTQQFRPINEVSMTLVDAGTMTESPATPIAKSGLGMGPITPEDVANSAFRDSVQSVSNFPLPPSVPVSPVRNMDSGTQYTPSRSMLDSPVRQQANFNTPPKTVWDEAQEPDGTVQDGTVHTPKRAMEYSGLVAHDTYPISPVRQQSPP